MYLPTYLPTYLSTYLPTYVSIVLPTYLCFYCPTYLPIYLLMYVSIYLSIHSSTHSTINSSIHPSIRIYTGMDYLQSFVYLIAQTLAMGQLHDAYIQSKHHQLSSLLWEAFCHHTSSWRSIHGRTSSMSNFYQRNEWAFRLRFCTVKVTLGWG